MSLWVRSLQSVGARGLDCVMVTLASGKGSTPREAGAKMIVTPEAIYGTIGGGDVEYQATGIAREMLGATDGRRAKRFALGASLGQHCGGVANLLFERVAAGAEWVRVLSAWLEAGDACILVTPVSQAGEDSGEGRLLVRASARAGTVNAADTLRAFGTLGDAGRDERAADAARRLLAEREPAVTVLQVGEGMSALLEPVEPVDFNIVLFGAGHVGRAIVKVLGVLAVRVTWVDSRASEFPPDVPDNVHVALTDTPLAEVSAARPGSWFLVMTHSHAIDLDLVEAILGREDIAFCGMIGSDTKRRTFGSGLTKRGIGPDALSRFTCPIGIPSLSGKDPGTIAVAVAAQLLECRERAASASVQASGTSASGR